jgi:actin-related protein
MELLWRHAFTHELHVLPEQQPVLLTDSPTNEKSNRERMAQVAFESLDINALNISSQAVLALYATGRTTGVVLDSGEAVTHATPIVNGVPIPEAVQKMEAGAKDVADRLVVSLSEKGYFYTTRSELGMVRYILKHEGYVATNYRKEMQLDEVERPFKLPDGETILLGKERCVGAQVSFSISS